MIIKNIQKKMRNRIRGEIIFNISKLSHTWDRFKVMDDRKIKIQWRDKTRSPSSQSINEGFIQEQLTYQDQYINLHRDEESD